VTVRGSASSGRIVYIDGVEMRLRLIGLMSVLALAGGCASGPGILVEKEGVLPSAASFALLEAGDPIAASIIRSGLETAGWRVAERDPTWRVEVIRTRRGEGTGAFTSGDRPEATEAWTIPPAPRRWWRAEAEERSVLVAVLDGRTGEPAARARALTRRSADQESDQRLAAEAVAALLSPDGPPQSQVR
jgi:hypothetical protein